MHHLEFIHIADRVYPWFPPTFDRDSMGIDLPNANYDPDLGQEVLEQVVDNAVLAERLGYDGVLIFEQHGHPLALFGNALTGAAWLAAKTSGIRIVAGGPILNAYLTPVRLAEEIALIDALSGGRLTVAFPLGIGAQYHALGITDPVRARSRFHETIALLHKIWTEDGPFSWEGEHFDIPYVNVWPKPRQAPHPPVFLPSAGSRETIELAAKFRFTYQAILVPKPILLRSCDLFRELCLENGYEADPRQITAVVNLHVAETDEQARDELERHALWGVQNILRFAFHESFPPGHVSQTSLRGMMSGGYRSSDPSKMTWEDMGYIAGSPETVKQKLADLTGEMGAGRVIVGQEFSLPAWLQHKSMTLLAEQVMPAFRAPDGKAVWQREPKPGYDTVTERIGRQPVRGGIPLVQMGDERVPLYGPVDYPA